jgi:pyruvate kinase
VEINVKELESILDSLIKLKDDIKTSNSELKSIQNLQHYLNLRKYDLKTVQNLLTKNGFSSLGRSQSYILYQINKNILNISKLLNKEVNFDEVDENSITFDESKELINERREIFGDLTHKTKIMVTLPSEASNEPSLIKNLIKNNVSILRINTAHDDSDSWKKMADFIHKENELQNKNTKIYVDLAGPKIRTGKIEQVFIPFKVGSKYKDYEVELFPYNNDTNNVTNLLSFVIDEEVYKKALKKEELTILSEDKSILCKVETINDRAFIKIDKKVLIDKNSIIKSGKYQSKLYNLEKSPEELRVFIGDEIIISNDILGQNSYRYNNKLYKSIISCTNKEIFDYVKLDDCIFIDDGKIEVKVIEKSDIGLICKVLISKDVGSVIKEEKGINFPHTNLEIPAITEEDKKAFESIVGFADIIGLSFAQTKEDVYTLQNMINDKNIAIVPKIETKKAFNNLEDIIKALQEKDKFGIMIARGDLAIEVGFENLPFIQKEIFDICEASHTPVIYATQILESKMKKNVPSRAEVIDVSVASRADCIMLNKGPFIIDTLQILNNILHKMHNMFQKDREILVKKETI